MHSKNGLTSTVYNEHDITKIVHESFKVDYWRLTVLLRGLCECTEFMFAHTIVTNVQGVINSCNRHSFHSRFLKNGWVPNFFGSMHTIGFALLLYLPETPQRAS